MQSHLLVKGKQDVKGKWRIHWWNSIFDRNFYLSNALCNFNSTQQLVVYSGSRQWVDCLSFVCFVTEGCLQYIHTHHNKTPAPRIPYGRGPAPETQTKPITTDSVFVFGWEFELTSIILLSLDWIQCQLVSWHFRRMN